MITMTCNRLWPELLRNILQGKLPSDRPGVCCRIFKVKLAVLTSHLTSGKVFGSYDHHMSVIEYQERGLPHAHVIVKLQNTDPDVLN